jgi:hypothetical protein
MIKNSALLVVVRARAHFFAPLVVFKIKSPPSTPPSR